MTASFLEWVLDQPAALVVSLLFTGICVWAIVTIMKSFRAFIKDLNEERKSRISSLEEHFEECRLDREKFRIRMETFEALNKELLKKVEELGNKNRELQDKVNELSKLKKA